MTIIGVTGHRPQHLGGYSNTVQDRLFDLVVKALPKYGATQVISGMALGWDSAIARAAVEMNIPLIAAVPFYNQPQAWKNKRDTDLYFWLLESSEIVYIDRLWGSKYIISHAEVDVYNPAKLQKRNEWIVDNSEIILALWNGSTDGGTANCINYAKHKGKNIVNVWKPWVKHSGVAVPS